MYDGCTAEGVGCRCRCQILVGTHHLGCEGEVFWAGECADGAYIRKGLQAIFGHEARGDIEVFGDWECGVAPDFPVVHVAVVGLVCWAVEVGAGEVAQYGVLGE